MVPSKGEAASRQSRWKRDDATGLLARNLRRMAGKIKEKGALARQSIPIPQAGDAPESARFSLHARLWHPTPAAGTIILKDDLGTPAKMYGKSVQPYGISIHHDFVSRTLVVPGSR
jgi:hypothetical protein